MQTDQGSISSTCEREAFLLELFAKKFDAFSGKWCSVKGAQI